ncbi:hypothetical protein [Corynebacterium sp. ES2775-CONJ]|uniref:hypothetical protein n=1 Tax=Corynebacterium sp. ES2775-CONJ TaxID=2974029 RepID=UPI002167C05C|nr:hypothetical protein [Corynebacterium sp. ES2775-CONJ]MCS4490335.1 hypothetical protein [Corynebacterium sp. ES2775-CONJ]
MSQRRISQTLQRIIAILLLSLPLVVGAIFTVLQGIDPADSWSRGEEKSGAPQAVDDSALIQARRAAGEANSQAGFLIGGTKELVDATAAIDGATADIEDPIRRAREGSQQLSQGLVELQNATGSLGAGATDVANGVEQAVNQVVGFEVVRGQIISALDNYLAQIEDSKDPEVIALKGNLKDLRERAMTFQIDPALKGQLEKLRDGSREVANQLAAPGFAYHDGVYTATKGSKELADGLVQLENGAGEALQAVEQLKGGAARINDMANLTKDRIGAVQRAMPIAPVGTEQAEEQGITKALAPMYGFLIAALILLGSALASRNHRVIMALTTVLISLVGAISFHILTTGASVGDSAMVALILGLVSLASMMAGMVLSRHFSDVVAQILSLVIAVGQIAVVGWAWHLAAINETHSTWMALSALFPVHYPTAALVALGNSGSQAAVILAIGVLIGFNLAALGSLWMTKKTQA